MAEPRNVVFRQSSGALLGGDFIPGNSIVSLANGDQIFPAMLKAIRNAQHSIDLERNVRGFAR